MTEFAIQCLLQTPLVTVRDVACRGSCRHRGVEEAAHHLHLVFPYRGIYLRHVGAEDVVAEANQVLFFNPDEGYRVSHPVHGGDASLDIVVDPAQLRELAPSALVRGGTAMALHGQRLRLDPRAQLLAAELRHHLHRGAEPLAAESLTLALVRHALAPGALAPRVTPTGAARRRLVDRAKLVVGGDLARRWTLSDVAAELGTSPIYLTQVFQQVEGVPLYRYQLRLRLARALAQLDRAEDLSALALELGFSSHSHFSAAFRQTYGRSPSALRLSRDRRAISPSVVA